MIKSFKCRDTEAMFNGRRIERFINIQSAVMRKLALLNVAGRIEDLRVPSATGLRRSRANGKDNGVFVSTISGASASGLKRGTLLMSRLSIITKEAIV